MLPESLRVELKTKVSEIQESESSLVKMCAYTIKVWGQKEFYYWRPIYQGKQWNIVSGELF